jgi:hypothetical protein
MASAAGAEVVSDPRQINAGSPMAKYVYSNEVRKALFEMSARFDRALGIECIGNYQVKLESLLILQPIDLPDGAEHPVGGAWRLGYDAIRCGESKRYNIQFVAKPGAPPEQQMLAPGGTIASFRLYADAMVGAQLAANARLGGKCGEVRLYNTSVSKPPPPPENGKIVNGTWTEDWTFSGCSKRVTLPMRFTPAEGGGTNWSIDK